MNRIRSMMHPFQIIMILKREKFQGGPNIALTHFQWLCLRGWLRVVLPLLLMVIGFGSRVVR